VTRRTCYFPVRPRLGTIWRAGLLLVGLCLVTGCTTTATIACQPCLAVATLNPAGLVEPADHADALKICVRATCHTSPLRTINGQLGIVAIPTSENVAKSRT
jgi:hypothetical protein